MTDKASALTILSTSVIPLALDCQVCGYRISKASVVHWVCRTDERHELAPIVYPVHTECMGEAQ